MFAHLLLAAVVFGTWNAKWFPSGRAEHRAEPEVEARTVASAGRLLRAALDRIDPAGTNDVVICLNEIRGPKAASRLCAAIGRTNLAVAAVSGYRRRDRFDGQQDVILTTLPVADSGWSRWKNAKADTPPRGYAHARLVVTPAVTAAVFAVHLKSNYGATTAAAKATNARKRDIAARQILEAVRVRRGGPIAAGDPVVVAGDFNADRWRDGEAFFAAFEEAGFANALSLLPAKRRATYPNRVWGDATLDYLFFRNATAVGVPLIPDAGDLSDHRPVFVLVTAEGLR